MIGVFDSGVGGLTVLHHFLIDHPNYNYIYLGDTANVPYGNKSQETIYGYTQKAIDFLYAQGCRLIIIACNTSSAQALRRIQQEAKYSDLRVLGVIRPIAEKIVLLPNIERIGIIGTRATINSNIYPEEIQALKSDVKIFQKATPLLVPLIEEAWLEKPETKMILKKYLLELKVKQVQALVLACTHYPFLLKDIKQIMGKKCLVFDPGKVVSDSLGDYLKRHPEIKLSADKKTDCRFYTTDNPEKFKELGELFFKKRLNNVEKVNLS